MQKDIKELKAELELKRRELELTFAIDHVRDTMPEPSTMLANIVNVLTDELNDHLTARAPYDFPHTDLAESPRNLDERVVRVV